MPSARVRGDSRGDFFCRGDGYGEPKPDGDFPVAIRPSGSLQFLLMGCNIMCLYPVCREFFFSQTKGICHCIFSQTLFLFLQSLALRGYMCTCCCRMGVRQSSRTYSSSKNYSYPAKSTLVKK
jgi:hypothetical protein